MLNSDSADGLSPSFDAGAVSTPTPCKHEWILMQFTPGVIMGEDSIGVPVFVPSGPTESAHGCAVCDEPWRSGFTS